MGREGGGGGGRGGGGGGGGGEQKSAAFLGERHEGFSSLPHLPRVVQVLDEELLHDVAVKREGLDGVPADFREVEEARLRGTWHRTEHERQRKQSSGDPPAEPLVWKRSGAGGHHHPPRGAGGRPAAA